MSFSGLVLSFKHEIRDQILCSQDMPTFSLDILSQNIQVQDNIKSIRFYTKKCDYYRIEYKNANQAYFTYDLKHFDTSLNFPLAMGFSFLQKLHHKLFISSYIMLFFGTLSLTLMYTGKVLARKYRYKNLFKKKSLIKYKNLHILIGKLSFPLLILIIFSGTLQPISKTLIELFSTVKTSTTPKECTGAKEVSFTKLYTLAQTRKAVIKRVNFADEKNCLFVFRLKYNEELHPNGRSYLSVNPMSNLVEEEIDARYHPKTVVFLQNIYSFHSGKLDPYINKFFLILAGLVLIFLSYIFISKKN